MAGVSAPAFWDDAYARGARILSIGIASQPLFDIPGVLQMDGSPPFYYMLLSVWMVGVTAGAVASWRRAGRDDLPDLGFDLAPRADGGDAVEHVGHRRQAHGVVAHHQRCRHSYSAIGRVHPQVQVLDVLALDLYPDAADRDLTARRTRVSSHAGFSPIPECGWFRLPVRTPAPSPAHL